MDRVAINELKADSLYHFTETSNLRRISNVGLIPYIGENSHGIEDTPKIFFSKGEIGILKVTEVWLRWLMNRIYGPNNRLGIYNDLSPKECGKEISTWSKEFLSGEYLDDEEKKEFLFDYFYEYLQERTYLTLDIEEGKEYCLDDIDENKVMMKKTKDELAKALATVMYGDFSNMSDIHMDEWNMHTKTGKAIKEDKIRIVTTENEDEDMLSLVLCVYDRNKDIPHNRLLLDDFVIYANNRKSKEGNKYDQTNNSRSNKGKVLKRSH